MSISQIVHCTIHASLVFATREQQYWPYVYRPLDFFEAYAFVFKEVNKNKYVSESF